MLAGQTTLIALLQNHIVQQGAGGVVSATSAAVGQNKALPDSPWLKSCMEEVSRLLFRQRTLPCKCHLGMGGALPCQHH